MSKYSVKVEDRYRDIVFRNKREIVPGQSGLFYSVYIGEECWGQVYDMGDSWTAIANKPGEMNMVQGFARRLDAAFYIIQYMQSGEGCSIHDAPHMGELPSM